MASWLEFETAAAEFGAAGRRLLVGPDGVAIGFLASVGASGTPHPAAVCPIFCEADLYLSASTRSASSGFMIFVDVTVGVAGLATARWRKQGSAYARSATEVLSWALLVIPVLGTLTSLYCIFAVRNQERLARRAA